LYSIYRYVWVEREGVEKGGERLFFVLAF